MRKCSRDGCSRPHKARGLCAAHYQSRPIEITPEVTEAFLRRAAAIKGDLGCWIWPGHIGAYGYGHFHWKGGRLRAHRVSYQIHNGYIPPDAVIDHICRTRSCVNPEHLRLLANVENVMIGVSPPATNARRTRCSNGHEFDSVNTYISPRGWRYCRICERARSRKYAAARREANPPRNMSRDGACMADDCQRRIDRRGLCMKHYARKRRAEGRKLRRAA